MLSTMDGDLDGDVVFVTVTDDVRVDDGVRVNERVSVCSDDGDSPEALGERERLADPFVDVIVIDVDSDNEAEFDGLGEAETDSDATVENDDVVESELEYVGVDERVKTLLKVACEYDDVRDGDRVSVRGSLMDLVGDGSADCDVDADLSRVIDLDGDIDADSDSEADLDSDRCGESERDVELEMVGFGSDGVVDSLRETVPVQVRLGVSELLPVLD